jgi:hypothetical protein
MAGLGSQSPNQRESLSAVSSITGNSEYVFSTNHALNINATISPAALPSTAVNNQQIVTTSAVALPSGVITQGFVLQALSTNSVSVFAGGVGVTTATGIELPPGSAVSVLINNTNKIYVICASGSPVVTWLGS